MSQDTQWYIAEPYYGQPITEVQRPKREMSLKEMEAMAVKLRPTAWDRILRDEEDE